MLQAIRRYWYLFTLLFIMLGSFFSGWSWFIISHLYTNITTASERPISPSEHVQRLPTPTFSTYPHAVGMGARLLIPRISVDAPLEAVGIAADGSMAVPVHQPWNGVGWYKYGPYPGEVGSAVLAGHLNHPNGSPAVFWKLRQLHRGDIVIIKENTGKMLRFSVLDLKVYTLLRAPKQIIFGRQGGSFLNLITCAGVWQPGLHQTNQRLVVYTKLVTGSSHALQS